ncbi:conserved membrane hypothetical protein [Rhodospirillaceae bacterium LM-1]|nr:conserved membrane hypothetical protein [Rhodospirillaceae bacterium LM-1]
MGFDPFFFNLLLPLPLALALAWMCFRLTESIHPDPRAGFLAAVLCVFFAWLLDDLPSATPRSFAVPLFIAVLVALAEGRMIRLAVLMGGLGLIYPQAALAALGVLALNGLADRSPDNLKRMALGLLAGLAALLPLALTLSPYGPVLSGEEARLLPSFQANGRSEFFAFPGQPLGHYLCGLRSGLLPPEWGCYSAYKEGFAWAPLLALAQVLLAALLLAFCAFRLRQPAARLPLMTALSGIALFAASSAMLFSLHLPGRYTQTTLRSVVMIALAALICQAFPRRNLAYFVFGILMAGIVGFAPFIPRPEYVEGKHPVLYQTLASQPREALVAGLDEETDNIPTHARRAILFGREYLIPYSQGYDRQMRQRVQETIAAWHTSDPALLRTYLAAYRPSHLLIRDGEESPQAISSAWWAVDFPSQAAIAMEEASRQTPLLFHLAHKCEAARSGELRLIDAACVLEKL